MPQVSSNFLLLRISSAELLQQSCQTDLQDDDHEGGHQAHVSGLPQNASQAEAFVA